VRWKLTHRPRVILVANEGHLVGLVTVKDVLRHEAQMEHEHATSVPVSAAIPTSTSAVPREPAHIRNDSASSWATGGAGGNWEPVGGPIAEDGAAGLEVALEEGLRWMSQKAGGLGRAVDRIRGGGALGGRNGVEDAMEYELEEERPLPPMR
jgi:chloride channel 3/4/5